MQLTIFASGSSGNCALVSGGGAELLIDAGISLKRIRTGLALCDIPLDRLDGVLITHEHSDHIAGLAMLSKYSRTPIYAPRTVASRLLGMYPELDGRLRTIHSAHPFSVGALCVTAFNTHHDTPESVGYRFDGEGSLGFCTDLGEVTDDVRCALRGVDAALIEANHDEETLRYGAYPVYLKRRILSDHGHLSNAACGELAAFLVSEGARSIVLGHLSRENNTPAMAYASVISALEAHGLSAQVLVASPADRLSVEVGARCSA